MEYFENIDQVYAQSVVENKTSENKHICLFGCRMGELPEVSVNSPDIQEKAEQAAHTNNDIIGNHVESRQRNDHRLKNNKAQQNEKKNPFFECIVELSLIHI